MQHGGESIIAVRDMGSHDRASLRWVARRERLDDGAVLDLRGLAAIADGEIASAQKMHPVDYLAVELEQSGVGGHLDHAVVKANI